MPALPTGTVTFLFTDIEGSTRLWEQHPEAMQAALSQHDRMLRETIEGCGGYVVKLRGDGVHAVFAAAGDALAAALTAQRALAAASWPGDRTDASAYGPAHRRGHATCRRLLRSCGEPSRARSRGSAWRADLALGRYP